VPFTRKDLLLADEKQDAGYCDGNAKECGNCVCPAVSWIRIALQVCLSICVLVMVAHGVLLLCVPVMRAGGLQV